jgi:hypothetical protein
MTRDDAIYTSAVIASEAKQSRKGSWLWIASPSARNDDPSAEFHADAALARARNERTNQTETV